MTVNELKYVYIEETMSALGNEELMEAILDAVRKVKVKFQERQEVSDSLFGDGRFTPSEKVFQELRNEYPFLCK